MKQRFCQLVLTGFLVTNLVVIASLSTASQGMLGPQSLQAEIINFEQQGDALFDQADYNTALDYYNQALEQIQDDSSALVTARLLKKRGETYRKLGNALAATSDYQTALSLLSENQKSLRGDILNGLGLVQLQLGNHEQAQVSLEQALTIYRQLGQYQEQGFALYNLALLFQSQANYSNAIEYYRQAVEVFTELGQPNFEAVVLNGLGLLELRVGQYTTAQTTLNRALTLAQTQERRRDQGMILHNIGLSYGLQQDYLPAREYYMQALTIRREVNDEIGEQRTLNNLGYVTTQLGDHATALTFLEPALALAQNQADIEDEAQILDTIGTVYQNLGQYDLAWNNFNQALILRRTINDLRGEATTLRNLGNLFDQQNQPELAIVFYKQSINVIEGIKQDLYRLPLNYQQSFSDIFAETYRRLAELLLTKERVLEAQQVLDLLKIHEIDTYFQDVRSEIANRELNYWNLEEHILDLYNASIQVGQELIKLREIPVGQLTSQQRQQLTELGQQEGDLLESFYDFLSRPDISDALQVLRQISQGQAIDPVQLNSLQNNLQQLNQNAVLLYPLVLEDHLELVLVSAFSPPIHYPVKVTQAELNATVVAFRQALADRNSQPKPMAQQLYQWLVAPIEQYLEAAQAETIVYAPDRSLRYIPLAALHDGEQWLVERYRINHITAASLIDLTELPAQNIQLLAAAFASNQHTVTVAGRDFQFAGLPYARIEIDTLAAMFPATTRLIDLDFSPDTTIPVMGSHSIVHLATHATFMPDDPNASFIVFGNGEVVTITDIRRWNLRNVDLVILSACETGLVGFGDGTEILGFGYQMQRTGARAAIASLWPVHDNGTQELMTNFYKALQVEGNTKAEAIRQAQISLIESNRVAADSIQRFSLVSQNSAQATVINSRLSHPYYWAPFILIGNGL